MRERTSDEARAKETRESGRTKAAVRERTRGEREHVGATQVTPERNFREREGNIQISRWLLCMCECTVIQFIANNYF